MVRFSKIFIGLTEKRYIIENHFCETINDEIENRANESVQNNR